MGAELGTDDVNESAWRRRRVGARQRIFGNGTAIPLSEVAAGGCLARNRGHETAHGERSANAHYSARSCGAVAAGSPDGILQTGPIRTRLPRAYQQSKKPLF